MTNVMMYLAVRSVHGLHRATGDDGTLLPPLRPRLPSRYETPEWPEPDVATDIERDEAFQEAEATPRGAVPEQAPEAPRRSVPQPRAMPPPATPPADIGPATGDLTLRGPVAPGVEPAKEEHLERAILQAPAPAGEKAAADPLRATRHQPAPVGDQLPTHDHPRNDNRIPRAASAETNDRMQQVPGPLLSSQGVPKQPQDPVAPRPTVVTPLAEGRLIQAVPASPRPPDTPRALRRSRDAIEPQAPAPPRVQVTIGRLEIRAASVVPPVSPRAPRVPSMSLDDYLTKRNRD